MMENVSWMDKLQGPTLQGLLRDDPVAFGAELNALSNEIRRENVNAFNRCKRILVQQQLAAGAEPCPGYHNGCWH